MGVVQSQGQILHAGFQKKLDGLDELIDTLKREKEKERDADLREVEEAKEVLQMAREDYSRGDRASLQTSWLRAERAECMVYFGRQGLERWMELFASVTEALK